MASRPIALIPTVKNTIHVMQHPLILNQINEPHRLGPKKATYVPMVFAVDNLKVTYMYYMWYNF